MIVEKHWNIFNVCFLFLGNLFFLWNETFRSKFGQSKIINLMVAYTVANYAQINAINLHSEWASFRLALGHFDVFSIEMAFPPQCNGMNFVGNRDITFKYCDYFSLLIEKKSMLHICAAPIYRGLSAIARPVDVSIYDNWFFNLTDITTRGLHRFCVTAEQLRKAFLRNENHTHSHTHTYVVWFALELGKHWVMSSAQCEQTHANDRRKQHQQQKQQERKNTNFTEN